MSGGMWAEKYRPKTLDDMVNQVEIVSRLKSFVKEKNLPHLLLVGPPGVGKTTSILCLARDLYGPGYLNYTLELNASDERGIDVIRDKVKNFASTVAKKENLKIIPEGLDALYEASQGDLRKAINLLQAAAATQTEIDDIIIY